MLVMVNETQIIAEVKTKSPFGFESNRTWTELFNIANEISDMVSIHTDARWGGSFDLLERARNLTSKPILAKGFHSNDSDIARALDCGANYVLVVGRIPHGYVERCFIEPFTLKELYELPLEAKVVWNSRDLSTGKPKYETFEQARELWKGWLCQASYIKTIKDIKPGANTVLVGTHLEMFAASLRELGRQDYSK